LKATCSAPPSTPKMVSSMLMAAAIATMLAMLFQRMMAVAA
jgi:hypothetical protein